MSETRTPPTLEQRAEQLSRSCCHMRDQILSALQDVRAEGQRETKTEGLPGTHGQKSSDEGAPVVAPERCDCSVHLHCGRCHGVQVEPMGNGARWCLECGFREGE
jgi:hypothetical protein